MFIKNKIFKKFLNVIYYVFVISCLVYGIGSITYANPNTQVPDVVITYNANGESIVEKSNLFGDELWYPGKEKIGLIRINNNFRKIKVENLGLNIDINQFNPYFNKDAVYNSFISNFVLTIKKDNFIFDDIITDSESLSNLITSGIYINATGGPIDLNYTLKMNESAGNELQSVVANVNFIINAKSDDPPSGGGGNGGGGEKKSNPPSKPSGDLIDRMPGYIALNTPIKIDEMQEEIVLPFNIETLRANGGHTARIYYWNESVEKWIALATYPNTTYTVKAINDGGYTGWFNVFGVIQPNFNDLILGHWAEPVTNRMNGLGIIEGCPGDGLIRPAQLEQPITRTEFTTLIFRLLNINPDKQILENIELNDARRILNEYYEDASEIPDWVAGVVAATTKVGLVETREGKFLANEPITHREAAVMVSKAFKILEEYHPIDYTIFKDVKDLPDWAKAALAKNIIEVFPENNEYISRAEALTVLRHLFIMGMGL